MKIKFSDAIKKAIADEMRQDKKVICLGLGTPDPKGVFGTTLGLQDEFGIERVFDIPTSENAVTGVCVGLGIAGYRPIFSHQRVDFALLSLDQIINNAAKLHYMFGGHISCPIVLRMVVGRGWGQGPTHSQNLQQLFAGIPGLKVIIPATSQEAYSQLRASIRSNNPIIFLEHRWLHNMIGDVSEKFDNDDIKDLKVIRKGKDCTVLATSYMVPEAIKSAEVLKKFLNIDIEIISFSIYNLSSIKTVLESVKKTGFLIIADTAQESFSISHKLAIETCKLKLRIKKNNIKNINLDWL